MSSYTRDILQISLTFRSRPSGNRALRPGGMDREGNGPIYPNLAGTLLPSDPMGRSRGPPHRMSWRSHASSFTNCSFT